MKAIRVHSLGGPEVLQLEDVPDPAPERGRGASSASRPRASTSSTSTSAPASTRAGAARSRPGQEAAGTVAAVGPGVDRRRRGRPGGLHRHPRRLRRAGGGARGAAGASCPTGVTARQGAAAMLQGMTAHYLATSTYPLKPGDACLVHAAAGGVGPAPLPDRQAARRPRASAPSPPRRRRARPRGRRRRGDPLHRAGLRRRGQAPDRRPGRAGGLRRRRAGRPSTKGLDSLRPRGMMVLFGQSSGPVPPVRSRRSSTRRARST